MSFCSYLIESQEEGVQRNIVGEQIPYGKYSHTFEVEVQELGCSCASVYQAAVIEITASNDRIYHAKSMLIAWEIRQRKKARF